MQTQSHLNSPQPDLTPQPQKLSVNPQPVVEAEFVSNSEKVSGDFEGKLNACDRFALLVEKKITIEKANALDQLINNQVRRQPSSVSPGVTPKGAGSPRRTNLKNGVGADKAQQHSLDGATGDLVRMSLMRVKNKAKQMEQSRRVSPDKYTHVKSKVRQSIKVSNQVTFQKRFEQAKQALGEDVELE